MLRQEPYVLISRFTSVAAAPSRTWPETAATFLLLEQDESKARAFACRATLREGRAPLTLI